MTNPYYNETFTAALGSQARSRALDNEFQRIQAAFDALDSSITALTIAAGRRFTLLEDCPSTLTAAGLKLVRVNAAASALEFVAAGNVTIRSVAGTGYTLVAADAGAVVLTSNGSAVTVTVPPDVFEQGDIVMIQQYGAGQVTFAEGSGVTINSSDDLLSTRTQYAQVALECIGSNEFTLIGERDAPTLGFASLTGGNVFTGAQTVTPVVLTDAANIATDAALGNHFTLTLGGNRTLDNPNNLQNGVILNWKIKQDGTGSRTLAYGSKFKFAGGSAPTLSTTAAAVDYLSAQYFSDDDILIAAIIKDVR